ncbi:hypothetical protein [Streptomyces sp. NPDC051286]
MTAGEGTVRLRPPGTSDGLGFASEAVPGLLAPFLERTPQNT